MYGNDGILKKLTMRSNDTTQKYFTHSTQKNTI